MSLQQIADVAAERFADVIVARGEVTITVDRAELLDALAWLRDEPRLRMDFLSCVTATHWPGREPVFWVAYELRSMPSRHRARVKVGLSADDSTVPSAVALFPTADWLERETYDFYGVVFDGHPDLTRILMPANWEGFPLRKDEPLGGVPTWYHGTTIPPVDQRGMA